jgi:hypothetical protein
MLQEEKKGKSVSHTDLMIPLFFGEILGIDVSLKPAFQKLVEQLLREFDVALTMFAEFDDNKMFFSLLWENWKDFIKGKTSAQVILSAEDLLWLRGTLKHITYYNKRYLIPG